MPRSRSTILVGVLLALALFASPAAAQDATPGAGSDRFPISPDPADCTGEPMVADDLLALWYGPDGSPVPVEPYAEVTAVTIELGTPADEATAAAVTDAVIQVFSCFAAGDALRAFSYFTDDLARVFGPEPGTPREAAAAFLTMIEPEDDDEAGQILAVTDASVLADGRVGVFVVERSDGAINTSYALFEQVDGRWLVDEVIEFGPASGEDGPEGTPAP